MASLHWLDLAEAAALQVGERLRRYFVSGRFRMWEKREEWGLVTEADIEAHRLLEAFFATVTPEVPLVSEEGNTTLPEGTRAFWVADPVDGTTNFAAGLPFWGVLIAYVEEGYPQAAAMYFPMLGELYTALRGQGAWRNREPIRVQPPATKETRFMYLCSDTPWLYQIDLRYKSRILGCGAYHIALVASGKGVLSIDCAPFVWDFAAPTLVLQEAGGVAETLEGQPLFPLQPGQDWSQHYHTVVAASAPEYLAEARAHFQRRFEKQG